MFLNSSLCIENKLVKRGAAFPANHSRSTVADRTTRLQRLVSQDTHFSLKSWRMMEPSSSAPGALPLLSSSQSDLSPCDKGSHPRVLRLRFPVTLCMIRLEQLFSSSQLHPRSMSATPRPCQLSLSFLQNPLKALLPPTQGFYSEQP